MNGKIKEHAKKYLGHDSHSKESKQGYLTEENKAKTYNVKGLQKGFGRSEKSL